MATSQSSQSALATRSSWWGHAFGCACALLLCPPLARAQAAPLTLDGAITRALAANRGLAAARLVAPVAAASVDVARERLNPEVTYEAARETPHQAIGASLPIERGGKRQRRIELAEKSVASRTAEIDRMVVELRDRVRRGYFALVIANRRVTLADDLHGLAVRARDAAQARFTAGEAPRLETLQAELALVDTENEASATRGEARAAAELNSLLAQPFDTPLALADDLDSGALPSLDSAVALASRSNADLLVFERQIAEQMARRDLARSMQSPDLTAGASYTYDAEPEFSRGFRASVGITVPLFTRHTAGVILEEAELARLTAQRAATVIELRGVVTAAFTRAISAKEQLARRTTESLPLASEVERMAQDSYSAGQSGLVTLLQAVQFTRDVRRRNLDAGAEYQRARADLERAIGAPLP